jgi:uncharacterized Zn finger protein (UPF0148 family)
MEHKKICTKCDFPLDRYMKFCPICGSAIEKSIVREELPLLKVEGDSEQLQSLKTYEKGEIVTAKVPLEDSGRNSLDRSEIEESILREELPVLKVKEDFEES